MDESNGEGTPAVAEEPEAEPDAEAAFAGMMSAAGTAAATDDPAPYGYTRDRATGEVRPKKAAGRGGKKPPTLEELKAAREDSEGQAPAEPAADRAPSKGSRRGRRKAAAAATELAQPKQGVIARAMNRQYRRAARLIMVVDPEIGEAIRSTTIAQDEDDVTVGEAWEELARANPRVRRLVLKMIAGGAVGQLVAVHAPIVLAVLMKDAIRKHIPFMTLVQALLSDDGDEDGAGGLSAALGGLQPDDVEQMMATAQSMMPQMMATMMARRAGSPRQPAVWEGLQGAEPGPDAAA